MAFGVGQAAIRLLVDVDDQQARSRLGAFAKQIGSLSVVALPVIGALRTLGGAVGGFASAAREAALQAAALARRADQMGTSAGELDRFTRSARALADVPFDRAIDALETFQERVGEAAFEPDSQIAALFDRIGVSVRTAADAPRDTLRVWDDFVDVVGKADRATRNFLTAEFGDVVRDIALPLARSAEAAAEYEAALRYLAALDEDLVDDAADANAQFELLGDTVGALTANLGNFAAKYAGVAAAILAFKVGQANRGLFGSALALDLGEADEAQAYLDGLAVLLARVNEQIDAIDDARPDRSRRRGATGASPSADSREELARLRELIRERQRFAEAYVAAFDVDVDAGTRDNQFVSELTRQFNLASTNASALAAEIDRLRADGGDPGLVRFLEQQLKSLRAQRETKDVETDRLLLQEALVGLSGEDAKLAELRHRLARETDAEEQARLATRIEIVERIQAGKQALQEQQAIEAAIADLTLRIERAHHGIEEALLDELGVTRQMLAGSAELAALFDAMLAQRRDLADAAREEAAFGDVARALDEERARAAGVDVRLHRILADLQRQGVAYGQQDLERLREELALLDELAFANDLRDDLRGSVADGLRDGLRDFAEGGDIGDVFDAIGRRLSSLLLDLAIGGFGQGGAGGTGLLGFLGSLFGGARADGGPVSPGRLYLVGERGPELFMPRAPGRVLAGLGGGAPTVVQHISVRGSVRSDADVAAIAQRVAQQSSAGIAAAIRHGRLAEA